MAVEARHPNLLFPQLIQDYRYNNLVNISDQGNMISAYNGQNMRFPAVPFPATTLPGNTLSLYKPVVCGSVHARTSANTESGLTQNIPATRKRSRDSVEQYLCAAGENFPATQRNSGVSPLPAFVGDSILPQIQQFQLDVDSIICQHMKKIKVEVEERQNQQAKLLAATIGEGVMEKMKQKEEQIHKMGRLNLALQEKVKSLYVENQLWRDLAQTNEATANSLRTNLEQVLANFGGGERISDGRAAVVDEEDVQSCCGSTDHRDRDTTVETEGEGVNCYSDRRCRNCGDRQSSVLLLPCRHLCLCNVCGSGSHQVQACPVCNSSMTGTLHVDMSC